MVTFIPGRGRYAARLRRLCAGLILAGLNGGAAAAGADDPAADPAAVVTSGDARFTVLTPQMIRMEWSGDARFEDRASLVFLNRRLPVPPFTAGAEGDALVIRTGALELRYRRNSGRFTQANLSIALQAGGRPVVWRPGTPDTGNLKGTTRTLDGVNGATRLDPGLLSRDGWTVVDDSARLLFDNSDWPWVAARASGDRQDFYFLGYGHDYRRALGDFVKVAGRIPLPPRFVFGSWWSRYWAYTDAELMELVADFRAHDLPLDVLVIDMDWHLTFPDRKGVNDDSGHSLGWTGYTWNRNYFPEPEKFLAWAHAQGLKTTVNLHPASGVQPFEEAYPEMARAMGIDPATRQYVRFDIADKRFAGNYLKILHHPLERQGIDFFWLDWQQEGTTDLAGLNPTFWLNYVHSSDMERRGRRPSSITGGAASATTATRSAFPATRSRRGNRWPSSPASRQPRPTSATATGATTSAGTCPAGSIRSCTRAGSSSARSAPSCARTPRRTPRPSAASGRIRQSTTT